MQSWHYSNIHLVAAVSPMGTMTLLGQTRLNIDMNSNGAGFNKLHVGVKNIDGSEMDFEATLFCERVTRPTDFLDYWDDSCGSHAPALTEDGHAATGQTWSTDLYRQMPRYHVDKANEQYVFTWKIDWRIDGEPQLGDAIG